MDIMITTLVIGFLMLVVVVITIAAIIHINRQEWYPPTEDYTNDDKYP